MEIHEEISLKEETRTKHSTFQLHHLKDDFDFIYPLNDGPAEEGAESSVTLKYICRSSSQRMTGEKIEQDSLRLSKPAQQLCGGEISDESIF